MPFSALQELFIRPTSSFCTLLTNILLPPSVCHHIPLLSFRSSFFFFFSARSIVLINHSTVVVVRVRCLRCECRAPRRGPCRGCVKISRMSRNPAPQSPRRLSPPPPRPTVDARPGRPLRRGEEESSLAALGERASFWLRKTAVSLSNDQRCQLNQSEDSEIMTNECKQPIVAEVNK